MNHHYRDADAVIAELDPAEAAHLLDHLVRGYQTAYQAATGAYGSRSYQTRRAMAEDLDRLALDEHQASYAIGMRQPGETTTAFLHRTQEQASKATETTGGQPMACPEFGEDAQKQPPMDLVKWQAHGIEPAGWSHRDGSALCPVLGPSGGYQPAQSAERQPEPDPDVARLDPPATMRTAGRSPWQAAAGDLASRAGERGAIPRQHVAEVIRRLDVTGPGPILRDQPVSPAGRDRRADREAGE